MWSRWHCVLLPVLSAAGSDHTHQPNLLPCWFMIQNICRKWLSWDKLPLHKPLIAIPERWMYFLARSADLAAVTNRGIVSHSFIPPSVFEQCLGEISQHLPEVRVQGLRGRATAVKRLHQHNKSELPLKSMAPKKAGVFYTNTTMVGLNHTLLLIVMISTLSLQVTTNWNKIKHSIVLGHWLMSAFFSIVTSFMK